MCVTVVSCLLELSAALTDPMFKTYITLVAAANGLHDMPRKCVWTVACVSPLSVCMSEPH